MNYPDAGAGSPIVASVDAGIGEASIRERSPSDSDGPAPKAAQGPRSAKKTDTDSRHAQELRILQMLEQGRISVSEAGELIAALHGAAQSEDEDDDADQEEEPGEED